MSLYSPNPHIPEKTDTMYIVNPTVSQFHTSYLNDRNETVSVTLSPLETKEFSPDIGQIVLTHLANFILYIEGFSYKTSPKKEIEAIKRRCIVHE